MTEQERQAEVPNQFPRIPKAIVDIFICEVWQKPSLEKKHEMATKMKQAEPFLNEIIEELAQGYGDTEGVMVGAYLTYEILTDQIKGLPKVTQEVAETLRIEYLNFGIPEQPINPFVSEKLTERDLINPTLDPYHYAEENPSLMVWFAELPDDIQVGCMIVYGLKRRQFHADQLTKQIGN